MSGSRSTSTAGAGVSNESIGVGTYWTPPGTTIIEYPVFTQTYTYTASSQEGSSENEEFTFNDKNGLNIAADIGVSYSVNPDLAPKIHSVPHRRQRPGQHPDSQRHPQRAERPGELPGRRGDLWPAEAGAAGPGAERCGEILRALRAEHRKAVLGRHPAPAADRARSDQPAHRQRTGRPGRPGQVVATATANANAAIEAAKGQAQANQLIAESIRTNPEIIQLKAIEKWNGVLPTYTSNGPLLLHRQPGEVGRGVLAAP